MGALQQAFFGLHEATGLPWWATIMAVTVGIRSLTLPVAVMQMKNTANMQRAKPEIDEYPQLTHGGVGRGLLGGEPAPAPDSGEARNGGTWRLEATSLLGANGRGKECRRARRVIHPRVREVL